METRSAKLYEEAVKYIPGGVNSPVRACGSVDSFPLFISHAKGSKITSVDGVEYIDFVESWGPMLLGHAHPEVTKAVQAAIERGTSFGAPCEDELVLAKMVCEALPSVEMVRMVSSGTEATMSALRLARAYTGRNKMIKFDGGYHGHGDAFLAAAGSGVATFSVPGTPGVPDAVVSETLIAPYNDLNAVEELFKQHGNDIAAVFAEPAAGNMGLIIPEPEFLPGLRSLCDKYGALLVLDEVITGFRVSYSGAQGHYGVKPDLTTMGKIIGGGMPVGAFGGRREIMQMLSPTGPVYQAGTLSGNPVAMAAGIATLKVLQKSDYPALASKVENFCQNLEAIFAKKGVQVCINRLASMFTIFLTGQKVKDFASAKTSDLAMLSKLYKGFRERGVYVAPSGFEVSMVSFAHTDEDFARTLSALEDIKL
ncbi:glutamate-1-semialdehyde 2,1-aminomutase [Desulfovibrio sp. OttesenSCG-928-C06]|nr:glutamate-1-semialdehyde 2,1-aminomutase [Desulfovibrio sp. OttesenSCG-928-C06]